MGKKMLAMSGVAAFGVALGFVAEYFAAETSLKSNVRRNAAVLQSWEVTAVHETFVDHDGTFAGWEAAHLSEFHEALAGACDGIKPSRRSIGKSKLPAMVGAAGQEEHRRAGPAQRHRPGRGSAAEP